MQYETLEDLLYAASESLQPTRKLSVSQVATEYRILNTPGNYVGPYKHEKAPYMVEPMDTLTSTDHLGLIFVGPAQSTKTELSLNFLAHSVMSDPGDMMIVQPTQTASREFSIQRVSKMFRDSPEIGKTVRKENVPFVKFKNGMILFLGHPTISQLSGKPLRRVWLADYDRMEENVEGEGSPYDLAAKRTTSFKRYGMTVAESSPGYSVDNPKWLASTPHEAPPTKGVLSLYNRGDRRRWHWKCHQCEESYEPDFSLIKYPDSADPLESAEGAYLVCPHCGGMVFDEPRKDGPGRYEQNLGGIWIPDGMSWNGRALVGKGYRSNIASFWLKGPAAAFTDFKTLVLKYKQALTVYEKTGDQEPMKSTVNTDQGLPYTPFGAGDGLLPENLKASAGEIPIAIVPGGVRYLLASIDIQKSKFVVQVHGICDNRDITFVDRFDIKKSLRLDEDGHPYPITPGAYPEDWHHIVDQVLLKQYPLSGADNKVMHIKATACDSGGREGVAKNAYTFWKWLRDNKEISGLHKRFHLVKGNPNQSAPMTYESYPDSERKDRSAGARGEVPVLMLNSNRIKDAVHKMLERTDPGGRINFSSWIEDSVYEELTVEVRTPKGWENPKKRRNESWDLLCYANALNSSKYIGGDRINWESPPTWAEVWEKNSLVADSGNTKFSLKRPSAIDFSKLGQSLT